MRFLVNMFNHSDIGQRSLEDVVGILGKQLRALGHRIEWDPSNRGFLNSVLGEGMNIVVEGFTPGSVKIISDAHERGARFIILATEEPTPRGFNHGTQIEMVQRQEMFPEAAKYADGIICLVPGKHVTDWYGQFAPTAWTELGYAPSLIRSGNVVPTYDFGFYGSLTKRRLSIIRRLANRAKTKTAVRVVADFKSQVERDQIMQSSKVIIQIRKFESMGLVSSSRCNTALCIGRPVIAEPHDLSKPWDEIIKFTSSLEQFYDVCLFARATWKHLYHGQLEAFKTKLSPENCAGRALREIGVLKNVEAA